MTLLTRLLGGSSAAHAELLSYLFFQPEFVSAAIAAGREDACELIAAGAGWRIGPLGRANSSAPPNARPMPRASSPAECCSVRADDSMPSSLPRPRELAAEGLERGAQRLVAGRVRIVGGADVG